VASLIASDWLLSFRFRHLGIAIDIGTYLATMHQVEPMMAGSFYLSNVLFCFAVTAVFSAYGLRAMIYTLFALNLYCLWMIVDMVQHDPDASLSFMVRRQIYLLIISAAVALLAVALSDRKIEAFRVGYQSGQDELANKVLAYALIHAGSDAGMVHLALRDNEKYLSAAVDDAAGPVFPEAAFDAFMLATDERPLIFDKPKSQSAVLTGQDRILIAPLDPGAARLAGSFRSERGLIVPLMGGDWQGTLVYSLPTFAGADHLRLADKIGRSIEAEVESYLSHRSAEQLAVARSKAALARDLHDSVAQSLSGARFWLLSLRSKIGENPEAISELEDIAGMLRDEHEHVNDLIENLHMDYPGFQNISLKTAMDNLHPKLVRNWRITVEVAVDPALGRYAFPTIHGIEQLVREAVANAVRHGRADRVKVHFSKHPAGIEIHFEDNGQGFEIGTHLPGSIAGRVREHGGTLDVVSEPGATRITVMFPA
jgi:signal transduction histidine kinase